MPILTVSPQKTSLVSSLRSPQAAPISKSLNAVKQSPISVNSPSVVVKLSKGSALAAPSAALDPTTLTAANIGSYTVSQLMAFTAAQVAKISNSALMGLSNTQLGGLSKSFFQAMSARQVGSLTASQIRAIGPSNIGSLNTAVKTNTSIDRALALTSLGQTNISILDSSTNFVSNLSAINTSATKISGIKFSNPSPKLQLSYEQYQIVSGIAAKLIAPRYLLGVSGVSVANLANLAQDSKVSNINVFDTAANISQNIASTSNIGTLKTYQSKIGSIAANDANRQTITVTQSNASTQYSAYQSVLNKLTGVSIKLNLTGSLINNQANTDQLSNFQAVANTDGTFNIQQWGGSSWKTLLSNTKGINLVQTSNATTYLDSGNAQVNAILNNGLTNNWQSGSASTPNVSISNAKIGDNFYALKSSDNSATTHLNISIDKSINKAAVYKALDYVSSIANISFTDVTGTGVTADIVYGENIQTSSAGYSTGGNSLNKALHASNNGVPTNNVNSVFVELASNQAANNTFTAGSYGWETIIHESAHALGLKHPGNYNAGGGGTPGPYLPSGDSGSRMWTVMSYNDPSDAFNWSTPANSIFLSGQNINPSTYMPLDIAGLQFLYGENSTGVGKNSWNTGNAATTVDNFQKTSFDSTWSGFETITTTHSSTLDLSGVTNSNIVDMRAGSFSSINILPANTNGNLYPGSKIAQSYFGLNNVALAYGNSINNVIGGSGNDTYFAGSNNETINDSSGSNILELAGSSSDWSIGTNMIGGANYQTFTNNSTKQLINANIANLTLKYFDSTVVLSTHTRLDLVA